MSTEKTPGRAPSAQAASATAASFWLVALGVAGLTFAVFVAYAFLSSAVYRTTAAIAIQPSAEAANRLPLPLEAARRLHDAVLDRKLLEELAKQTARAHDDASAGHLRDAFEVDTIDTRTFNISFRDSDARRAQEICNRLALRAAEVATLALSPERAEDTERDHKLDELISFVGSHLDVGANKAAVAGSAGVAKEDAAVTALRNERARLSAKLDAPVAREGSDNPYFDSDADPAAREMARRRIAEIDRVLASRRQALANPSATPPANAASLDVQWQTLLQSMTSAPAARAPESLNARVVSEAPLPTSPIEPNRKLVLFIGFLASLGAAGIVALARSASEPVRRSSARRRSQPDAFAEAWHPPSDGRRARRSNRPAAMPEVTRPIETVGYSTPPEPVMPTRSPSNDAPPIIPRSVVEVTNLRDQAPATQPLPRPDANASVPTNVNANGDEAPAVAAPDTTAAALPRDAAAGRRPVRGRVTQVLGTPQIPVDAAPEPVPVDPYASTSYGASDSDPARAHASSSYPPRQVSSGPPPGSARVNPLELARPFRPDSTLSPDARRGLRDALLPFSRQAGFVLGVFSTPEMREAKSRVAAELALSLSASSQCRLLLVEGDFQAPSVQRMMRVDVPMAAGLSLQLQTRTREHSADAAWTVLHCTRQLDLLVEGIIRSPEVLFSEQFYDCITSIRRHYDFVVIDGPLLTQEAECQALNAVTDGIVIVQSENRGVPAGAFSDKAFSVVVSG